MVRYVSNSVVMGFTTGIGILIAGNQLNQVLGIRLESKSNYLFEMISQVCSQISQINYHTLLIAIFTAALAVSLRKINRRIPGPLVGVVAMSFFVYIMGWHSKGVRILSDLTPISRGLNLFHVPAFVTHPDLQMIGNLSAGAVALAIFGLIEAATSSRAVAAMSGQRLNFSREFVAQGLANIAGSFFQNFASSASFIRTAECYNSGGRTRVAALMSGLFTALTLVALAPYANYIPIGSLAGVLIVIAYSLVQKKRLLMTWRSGSNSKMVFSVTLASTILFPLQYAIFVGIIMSLVLLLRATGKPDLTLLVPREQGAVRGSSFRESRSRAHRAGEY